MYVTTNSRCRLLKMMEELDFMCNKMYVQIKVLNDFYFLHKC